MGVVGGVKIPEGSHTDRPGLAAGCCDPEGSQGAARSQRKLETVSSVPFSPDGSTQIPVALGWNLEVLHKQKKVPFMLLSSPSPLFIDS